MADFNQTQTALNQARNQKEQTKLSLFTEKERLEKIKREKDALNRIFDQSNKAHITRMQQLQAQEEKTTALISRLQGTLNSNIKSELGLFNEFSVFTDPREFIGQMSDSYPILLMPVRIETRFKQITVEDSVRNQLWVRIFPDECAVDTFEPIPSETEIENTQFYWSALWQAGGWEDQERGAWRSLVSSHGSGRAAWLIQNYVPANSADQPIKANKVDIILVIPASQLPPTSDQNAILDYWKAYWLADGDKTLEENAFNALVTAVGAGNASNYLETYQPDNIDYVPASPLSKSDINLQAVFLQFPSAVDLDTKQQSWTQAPHTNVLPDRFVLMGYNGTTESFRVVGNPIPSPVIVGPDPSAEEDQQIKQENGEIVVGDDMKWMVDFDEAIKIGLGFKINITASQAKTGFDKIIALGVKISANVDRSRTLVEELIEHHKSSRKGFSLLPQGSPTNNTEKEGAGYKSLDDPDISFDNLKKGNLFSIETDWLLKKDGQWLAESLGISDQVLQNVMYSDGTDQREARAMNTALWPATLGYMMESLMQPVFSDNDVESTRTFFNLLVLGRGNVPAVKIGKQPYGIYPTTAFSKIGWIRSAGRVPTKSANIPGNFPTYLLRLYNVLKRIDQDWTTAHLKDVSYVGKTGDAHQILLDVIGLNPDSVEFYQRYAESFEDLLNRFNMYGIGNIFLALLVGASYVQSGKDLLSTFGYNGDETPDILEKIFLKSQNLLKGPLIDDVPLTEMDPIRKYTPDPDGHNYIRWLIDAASTSHNTLRKQDGFIDNKIPSALLYLMLHHALDLNYVDVSLKLHLQAELLNQQQVQLAKVEPAFIHVAQNTQATESKWQYVYKKESKITGNPNLTVGDYIPKVLNTEVATAYLKEQLDALAHLEDVSTAKLERAFVEHIDLCTYRLDAWKNGFMNYELYQMRSPGANDDSESPYRQGLYIGAYGILEEVRSENKILEEVTELDDDLGEVFLSENDPPLFKDKTNGGYIAAPSLNHAVTSAVLRNGYMENASQTNPDALSVNLSSERVRKALSLIEGIRGGQGLSELLGYRLERGLHESHPTLELDFYIYELRKAFPLRANRIKDTKDDNASIEEIEAKNVVDALALIDHVKTLPTASQVYPYGKPLSTDGLTTAIKNAIKAEVDKIMDLNDAISDVAMAESVHQVVQGNYDRGAATLNTYSKGNFPPIPDVIQTPRSGINLTHRVAVHLEPGLNPNTSPYGFAMTPRAKGEPGLNKWLSTILPAPANVVCKVLYKDVTDDSEKEAIISQANLQLQPIDLVYMLNIDLDQSMDQLDDLLIDYVKIHNTPRPDAEIKIQYLEPIAGKVTFFELAPLVNSLRSIMLNSRPLEAEDASRPTEEKKDATSTWYLDRQRIDLNKTSLETIRTSADNFHTAILAFTDVETPDMVQIISHIDTWASQLITIMKDANQFGNPVAGFGAIYDGKKGIFNNILEPFKSLTERWDAKLVRFDDLMSTVPGAATNEEKISILIQAEAEIKTSKTFPEPTDPNVYTTGLMAERANFVSKLDAIKALINTNTSSIATFLNNFKAQLPVSDYDFEEVDLSNIENQILVYAEDLTSRAASLINDLDNKNSPG